MLDVSLYEYTNIWIYEYEYEYINFHLALAEATDLFINP